MFNVNPMRVRALICGTSLLSVMLSIAFPVAAQATPDADSLILERDSGFSPRPAYRISIVKDGLIHFARRPAYRESPGPRTGTATVPFTALRGLMRRAERLGFMELPDEIRSDPALCPIARTDAASVVVSIHTRGQVKRVNVYEGCVRDEHRGPVPRVRALLDFARAIDDVAGTKRWLARHS
jgi:hypothetical protein